MAKVRGKRSKLEWCGMVALALCACSGDPSGSSGGAAGNGGDDDPSMNGNAGSSPSDPSQPMAGRKPVDPNRPGVDPCEGATCGPGQRCEASGTTTECIDNGCDDLDCGADRRCEAHVMGGHTCVDATCETDVDCPVELHCGASGVCEGDVCTAGVRACDGNAVLECADNGGENAERFMCSSAAYFATACVEASAGGASCSCEDDWDCPAFTVCEVGTCTGTGFAPTCSLPPIPFSDTPPAVELHWGGADRDHASAHDGTPEANAAPWPSFSQVLNTPIVANLDDDNGDGLIDERDFPEILFVGHKGDNPWNNGVLRAIHGGGPNKGADYFARCGGSKLWTREHPSSDACNDGDPDADSGTPVAVGDLNGDGVPEIVYTTEDDKFRILDNEGQLLYSLAQAFDLSAEGNTPAIANLDFEGWPEIIIGRNVYVLGANEDGTGIRVTHVLTGSKAKGRNGVATMACPADIIPGMPGQEIAVGASLYRMPEALPSCPTAPCAGTLDVVWHAPEVAGNSGLSGEGFCAVADVWGGDHESAPSPDNPPDGKPEVVLIDNGDLTILDGETGAIISDRNLGGGDRGGAPNVDDFDGDGFMEVASALQNFYVVVDLQTSTGTGGSCADWPAVIARKDQAGGTHNPNPERTPGDECTSNADCDAAAVCNTAIGHCVCLHNGWKRDSDDDSSKATSSSVFDFNGDGAAEVLYNDECDFRVYDGRSGEVLFSAMSRSRTGIENPVVADVDNDGNAEVVAGMNTAEPDRCDDDPGGIPQGPNGIAVWGDPTDTWVSARRVWNQQSYHVTNVLEGGSLPAHAPESWRSFGGRVYNTYRSQPRNYGVAPDLRVVAVSVSSPDAECGSLTEIVEIGFEIENGGDLRVGPGVRVAFVGTYGDDEEVLLDENGDPLEVVLQQSLEPGKSTLLTARFVEANNGRDRLPDEIRVVVDPASAGRPDGSERECREDNNSRDVRVEPGHVRADLRLQLGNAAAICPTAEVETRLENAGTASTESVLVRYYAGDPSQGGSVLYEQRVEGPLAPGETMTFTAVIPTLPRGRAITVYAVVDPDYEVEECNDANNKAMSFDLLACSSGPD